MLNPHTKNNDAAAADFPASAQSLPLDASAPLDKKTRERLAAQRKMAARRAIERHFERRALENYAKEYWFDG